MNFAADFDVDAFLAPLQEKYGKGEVVAVPTVAGPMAFRCPTGPEYARFKDARRKEGDHAAGKLLLLITVVSPDRVAMGPILEKKPGIIDTCLDEVLILAGVDPQAEAKK